MRTLIKNIGEIFGILPEGVVKKEGHEMSTVTSLKDAYITISDGRIESFGPASGTADADDGDDVNNKDDASRKVAYAEVIDSACGYVLRCF